MVIGVHSPEFAFEKNIDNVRRAVKDMRADYPIAIDSDHAIWNAFNNIGRPPTSSMFSSKVYLGLLLRQTNAGIFTLLTSRKACKSDHSS